MRKTILNILLVPQLIILMLLVVVRYIPSISPQQYEIMGVLGLLTPILAIINIIYLFFWLATRKYSWAVFAALGILVSWNVLSVCFGFNFLKKNELTKTEHEFTVMSYNVRLLDLYDWTGDENNRSKLLAFIKKKSPDVLCLQEFYTKAGTGLDNIAAIQQMGNYPYVELCALKRHQNREWGSVIFSRFPIEKNNNVLINEDDKNLIQEAVINRKGKRFKLYNVHLHSNKLSPSDIDWSKSKDMLGTAKKAIKNSSSLLHKLMRAYKQRGKEVDLSSYVMEDLNELPVMVCGDLNDLPSSYSYFTIRGKRCDAFLERGYGIGPTYNGKISFLRIDYLFFDEQLRLKGFEKYKVPYSDHYPLMGKFEL